MAIRTQEGAMSVESQAILSGHVSLDHLRKLIETEAGHPVVVRDMRRPEYKIIEFRNAGGSWSVLNVFLNSWAADDYAGAFKGPSTFLTAEYTPQNFNLVRSIAAAVGGLARKTDAEPWAELDAEAAG